MVLFLLLGLILGLIVGWFYVVFLACFVASIGRILWPNDKGCSGMVWVKMTCIGAAKKLSGTLLRGSHAIAWLGSKLKPSGTQLRGFPRNCVAAADLQVSNFGWSQLLRPNFVMDVLGLYGKPFESRIHTYIA